MTTLIGLALLLVTFSSRHREPRRPAGVSSRAVIVFCTTILMAASALAGREKGDLDTTFGTNGVYSDTSIGTPYDMLIEPTGNFVVLARPQTGGGTMGRFDLKTRRWNPKVSLSDSDFIDIAGIVRQTDGKIVVAGTAWVDKRWQFALRRYDERAFELDKSFGEGGVRLTKIGDGNARVTGIAQQDDGKLVVIGTARKDFNDGDNTERVFAVARYTKEGAPDKFGTDGTGTVTTSVAGQDCQNPYAGPLAVAIRKDGLIAVAGWYNKANPENPDQYGFALAIYPPDGSEPKVTKLTRGDSYNAFTAVAFQDDNIVAAGESEYEDKTEEFVVARFDHTGKEDPSFAGGGLYAIKVENSGGARKLLVQSNGKLVAAGWADRSTSTGRDVALVRYQRNGEIDTTFGSGKDGIAFGNLPGEDEAWTAALQVDGKIVTAGALNGNDGRVLTLMRFHGDEVHDSVIELKKVSEFRIGPRENEAEGKISVSVKNVDIIPAPEEDGHEVWVEVDEWNCEKEAIVGRFLFDSGTKAVAPTEHIKARAGKEGRMATLHLKFERGQFAGEGIHRCSMTVSAHGPIPENVDPTPNNNSIQIQVDVVIEPAAKRADGRGAYMESPDDTYVGRAKTLRALLQRGAVKSARVAVVVGNTGATTATAFVGATDGDCPTGTVGVLRFNGVETDTVVVGSGRRARGWLSVTLDPAQFLVTNRMSPARCVAEIHVSGSNGETADSNDSTILVIDVIDASDY